MNGTSAAETAAAGLIERFARRRLEQKQGRLPLGGRIESLRALRLSPTSASPRGAHSPTAGTELYSEEMIQRRERLRRDGAVVRVLDSAWERHVEHKSLNLSSAALRAGPDVLTY
eukprot:4148095-Prymnesium_polylepis.1